MENEATGRQSVPQLLTVSEVARAARVSKMTIYRMIHAGELDSIRVGNSYRVPAQAAEALLESAGALLRSA
jgi:excisionase family DNA binding protein